MINLHIRVSGIAMTEAIEDQIRKKVEHLEKLVALKASDLYVEISKTTAHHKSGEFFRAEFSLLSAGEKFRSEEEADDLYSAIDIAKDELAQMLRTRKDKKLSLFRRGAQRVKNMLRGFGGREDKEA
ncbi:MAG: ribosome-associated translation inhibitor RaiA [Patescibacteria group bacterium]